MKTDSEKLAIKRAYEDGKTIQCQPVNSQGHWCDLENDGSELGWYWDRLNYRIKPVTEEK